MLLDELGSYLTNQGLVGGSTGWQLFEGFIPATPDQVVVLLDAQSGEPREYAYLLRRPHFQVLVRGGPRTDGDSLTAARTQIIAILAALDGLVNTTLGSPGVYYPYIWAIGGMADATWDVNQRPEFRQNYRCAREA